MGGVAYLGGGEGEGVVRGGVGDERGGVARGCRFVMGAAVPVSSMKSGPVRASLSMTRVPVSVVGAEGGAGGGLVERSVGEGDGAALGGGEGGAAGGGGDEEGPLAGDAADGERGGAVVGEGEGLGAGLAGADLAEVEAGLGRG